jgi:hypothetical protein
VIKNEDFLKGIGPGLEVGMFLGMAGLFVTTFFWFSRRYPMLPVADPLLEEAVHGHH